MKIELTYKRFFNITGGIKGFLTLITRYINTIKAIIDIEKLVVVCIEIKPYISESVIPSKKPPTVNPNNSPPKTSKF